MIFFAFPASHDFQRLTFVTVTQLGGHDAQAAGVANKPGFMDYYHLIKRTTKQQCRESKVTILKPYKIKDRQFFL